MRLKPPPPPSRDDPPPPEIGERCVVEDWVDATEFTPIDPDDREDVDEWMWAALLQARALHDAAGFAWAEARGIGRPASSRYIRCRRPVFADEASFRAVVAARIDGGS